MFTFDKDLYIPEIDLWLDSRRVKPHGFISHAHADHIARHKKILCSPPTAELLRIRVKNPVIKTVDYNSPVPMRDTTVTLHPAGHILGSAQIKIANKKRSLLYSGDFRLRAGRTAESFELVRSDILIMETTFGKSHYKMPDRQSVEDTLITLCRDLLKKNKTPVVFAYALGKGQEALKILSDAGLPVAVAHEIARYLPVYLRHGISFGQFIQFNRQFPEGHVLLLPVGYKYRKFLRNISGVYTIFLSGWALDQAPPFRFNVDRMLPISDHADFDELIELVEKVNPAEIYCTHGFDSFVSALRNAGYRARTLEDYNQLDLFWD